MQINNQAIKEQSRQQLWDLAINCRINILLNNGGITNSNWEKYRKFIEQFNNRCVNQPSFTEALMFDVHKPGLTTEAFNMATQALAILAFSPGGVEFMGVHYEAKGDGVS